MTITAKVILQSRHALADTTITTVLARYPKFIHAEAKTHRLLYIGTEAYEMLVEVGLMDEKAFSRNASSSRAIPVNRLIQDVIDDPVTPSFSGSNKPGMQAGEPLPDEDRKLLIDIWNGGRDEAIRRARAMADIGGAKQDVNRIIEPYSHINVLITATEWDNFSELRCHPDAQPEMRLLAESIMNAIDYHTAGLKFQTLMPGQWHTPFVTRDNELDIYKLNDRFSYNNESFNRTLRKISTARCARLSYMTHEGKEPGIFDDLKLYDRLVGSAPIHASPAEHQATPDYVKLMSGTTYEHPELHGNLTGFIQHRKLIEKGLSV